MGRDNGNATYQTFRSRTAQVPLLSIVVSELLQLPFRGKLCHEDGAVQVGRRFKRWGNPQTLAFRVLPPVLLFPRSPLLLIMRSLTLASLALLAACLVSATPTATSSSLPKVDLGYEIHQAIAFNVRAELGLTKQH
jgi:hypothetical protein